MSRSLSFRSVAELGGITSEVVSDFFTVMRAHELSVRPDVDDLTFDQVKSDLDNPHSDLDFSGVWFSGDQPVMVVVIGLDEPARNILVDGYGVPDLESSDFIGLFEKVKAFAATQLAQDPHSLNPDDPLVEDQHQPDPRFWQVQLFSRKEDERYRRFMEMVDLKYVRDFYRMSVELTNANDVLPDFPGVELIPATTEPLQRQLKDLAFTSFREHWGSGGVERSFEEWKAMRESAPGFSWDRSWIVRLNNQNAGLLMNTDMLIDENSDYVGTLGVLKEFRGQGLAKWLLLKTFHDARKRGLTKVALNVDAENTTGAVALYSAVGMQATEVFVVYRAPVSRLIRHY